MKWNISVISGKETNKYFVSTGEGMQINRKKFLKPKIFYEVYKNLYNVRPKKVIVLYYKIKKIFE